MEILALQYSADELRELLSPAELLLRLGHRVFCTRNSYELHFHSPLKPDHSGRFITDERLGLWFDHSGDNASGIRGGDVIDLGKALYHPQPLATVLLKLSAIARRTSIRRRRAARRLPEYHIAELKPLGCTPEITEYLHEAGLWQLAVGQLKEVHYYVEDEKGRRKHFCAAGWANENGGWEVRARNFSGCIGHTGMSFLPGDEQQLVIFFDYKDYLVWRYGCRSWTDSALVINDLRFSEAAAKRARHYAQASVYAGKEQVGEDLLVNLATAGAQCIYLDN